MSTLRQDPLTGRWVIMAASRSDRPNEFRLMQRDLSPRGACPFCPGHESETTSELLAIGRPADTVANGPGWRMRVFPNKYPALRPDPPGADPESPGDLHPVRGGIGSHEVIVYSPDHAASLATLEKSEMIELLKVLRGRVAVLSDRPGHRYVSPFCNHGPEAGATLAHPHMQIIGTPELPPLVVDKAVRFSGHRARTGRCLLCDLVDAEHEIGDRVILADDRWTALAPWASRFPWEILLVPRKHQVYLTDVDDEDLASLAGILSGCLRGLAAIHGDPCLNLVIHGAPLRPSAGRGFGDARLDVPGFSPEDDFHLHLEILPRLSRPAGFEVGTGFTINSEIPETVARRLRAKGS